MSKEPDHRKKYSEILKNLSPGIQKIKIESFEHIRSSLFGGEYGQKIFNEKYLAQFENLRPFSPGIFKEAFDKVTGLFKQYEVCPDQDHIIILTEQISFLKIELDSRATAIQQYNYFQNDFLFFGKGFFPVRRMIELLSDIDSKLLNLYFHLNPESDATTVSNFNTKQTWQAIRLINRELEEYYSVLEFLEILYEGIGKNDNIEAKSIMEALWDFLNLSLQNARIHFFYIEPRPVTHNKKLEERISKDRTTRIKIFYSINYTIFEIRIDLAHEGEEFLHLNLHEADLFSNSFSRGKSIPLSEETTTSKLDKISIDILNEIELLLNAHLRKRESYKIQERDEKDSFIIAYSNLKIILSEVRNFIEDYKSINRDFFNFAHEYLLSLDTLPEEDVKFSLEDDNFFIDLLESSLHRISEMI